MAGKPNIRSIRFSDELAELIDRQVGNSFTEKFEGLITRCVWELPQKEAELKNIQERISRERQRLYDLQNAVKELKLLERDIQAARGYLDSIEKRTKAVAEAAEEDMIYL
ncbi:MAG: hypothetical protein NC489_37770 [Ruminococcus flavefaciens]|nr:hypothetical protein [Ruminococcus flavefaciens]